MLTALLEEERGKTCFKCTNLVVYAKFLTVFKKPNKNMEVVPMKVFKALN